MTSHSDDLMKKLIVLVASLSLGAAAANAQDLKAGFFLDNSLYGTRINPALRPSGVSSYYGMDANIGMDSNVGVSSFLFPYGDGLVTGLNKNIPADQFLGGLEDCNRVTSDLSYSILSTGKYSSSGKAFKSYGVNMRTHIGLEVPKSLFEMLKSGGDGDSYVINDLKLGMRSYAEVFFNYSRRVNNALTIGGTVKGLVGLAAADMNVSELSAVIDGDVVNVKGNGELRASLPAKFGTDADGNIDFENIPTEGFSLSGYGAAVDLGITYDLLDGALQLSASVNDLGAVCWNNNNNAVLAASNSFVVGDSDNAGDTLEEMFSFKSGKKGKSEVSMLPTMVNLGAKYDVPFVSGLGVGALCSFRMGDSIDKYSDIRVGASYELGRVFGISGTCGMSNQGFVYGAAANLRLACLNVFAGIDGIPSSVTPQFVPVDSMASVIKLGVAFAFGKGRGK